MKPAKHAGGASKSVPSVPVDEKLCNNCGKCCYKKLIIGRTVFITPFPCEYLDTATNLCTIYDRRHELNPQCLSIDAGMKVNAFPEDCPYVPIHAPANYRPAREGFGLRDDWHEFDAIADDLDVSTELREKIRARGPEAPPIYVETNARIQAQCDAALLMWGAGSTNVVSLVAEVNDATPVPTLAALGRLSPETRA